MLHLRLHVELLYGYFTSLSARTPKLTPAVLQIFKAASEDHLEEKMGKDQHLNTFLLSC